MNTSTGKTVAKMQDSLALLAKADSRHMSRSSGLAQYLLYVSRPGSSDLTTDSGHQSQQLDSVPDSDLVEVLAGKRSQEVVKDVPRESREASESEPDNYYFGMRIKGNGNKSWCAMKHLDDRNEKREPKAGQDTGNETSLSNVDAQGQQQEPAKSIVGLDDIDGIEVTIAEWWRRNEAGASRTENRVASPGAVRQVMDVLGQEAVNANLERFEGEVARVVDGLAEMDHSQGGHWLRTWRDYFYR